MLVSFMLIGLLYVKPQMDRIRREGRTTHWPEAHAIRFFNTITIDGFLDNKTLDMSAIKITEQEFSDLVLKACRQSLKEAWWGFGDVRIEHLGKEITFDNHPLNMGLIFHLAKWGEPFKEPKNLQITYKFSRRSLAWDRGFPDNGDMWLEKNDVITGRLQPGGTVDVFALPDTAEKQREAITLYTTRRCDELRYLMRPDADDAATYEAKILKNNVPLNK